METQDSGDRFRLGEREKDPQDELMDIIKRYYEEKGYSVKLETNIYKGICIDLLVEKDDKTLAIEVKKYRKEIFEALNVSERFRMIPEIDLLYIAAPNSILEEDILKFAQLLGVGILRVTEKEVEELREASVTNKANLTDGSSYPTSVVPGQIFSLRHQIENIGGKIARNIEISYIPVDPFIVPPEEVSKMKIDELFPQNKTSSELRIKVKEDTEAGWYPLFTKRSAQNIELNTSIIQIEVRPKGEEYIQSIVNKTVDELNHAISTNIENALGEIDRAVMDGYINLNEHVISKSIWNTIAMPCLKYGLGKQAETIYRSMLETIQKYENKNNIRLHKGLALHNIGMALFYQGKRKEAKEKFQEAYEEDKISYGEETARKGLAKKALDEYFKDI
jgi:tetratricopeptide (TPR) repeat protein